MSNTGWGSCGLEVDDSHIYWADPANNTIGRAGIDGGSLEPAFVALKIQYAYPCDVAVDSNYLYWSTLTGNIGRANLDGSDLDQDFISTIEQRPCGVAVDEAHIYWSDNTYGSIYRIDVEGLGPPEAIVTGLIEPCGVAVGGGRLFWTDESAGVIGRANLDGSQAEPNFIVGADNPSSVVVHGDRLFWVNAGSMPGLLPGSIGRANLDGTDVNQNFLWNLLGPWGIAVDNMPVFPPSPPPPVQESMFHILKIKRNQRTGTIAIRLELPNSGYFVATTVARVQILPDDPGPAGYLSAGRKWLIVKPGGRRCILGGLRRGAFVELRLEMRFVEPGKSGMRKGKRIRLYREARRLHRLKTGRGHLVVTCPT